MVALERQHGTDSRQPGLALGPHVHGAVDELLGARVLGRPVGVDDTLEHPVDGGPRRVACHPRGET